MVSSVVRSFSPGNPVDDEHFRGDAGLGGGADRAADLLSLGVFPHGLQQILAAGFHPVLDLDAAGGGHLGQERGVDGVDPGQRRPLQAQAGDVVADVADLGLVDDRPTAPAGSRN